MGWFDHISSSAVRFKAARVSDRGKFELIGYRVVEHRAEIALLSHVAILPRGRGDFV